MTRKIAISAMMAGLVLAGVANEAGEKRIEELNRTVKEMLSKAPAGKHGGKMITPEIMALMQERQGGLISPKTNGKTFLLIDARGADDGFLDGYVEDLKRVFHVPLTAVRKDPPAEADLFAAANGNKTAMSPAVVMIVKRDKAPVLSIYPEEAVGVVNVSALSDKDANVCRDRMAKEVSRAIGLTLGAYVSAGPTGRVSGGVLMPVHSPKDLDAIEGIGFSTMQNNGAYAAVKSLGLQAAKPVPYAVAVKHGWAPAPTNDIQKAIWDKVHAMPTAPLKIKPEAKKVSE